MGKNVEDAYVREELGASWMEQLQREKEVVSLHWSAEKGDVEAMVKLGTDFIKGEAPGGVDPEKSYYWFNKARLAGSIMATAHVALMLKEGVGIVKDENKAWLLLGVAAGRGSSMAAFHIGCAFMDGTDSVEPDAAEAAHWFQQVLNTSESKTRHREARQRLDELSQRLTSESLPVAILVENQEDMTEVHQLAHAGNVKAMFKLGAFYLKGLESDERNKERSFYWFNKARLAGSVVATAHVGSMLREGFGVTTNEMKALLLLGVAAGKGSDLAAFYIGSAFMDATNGLQWDTDEASYWIKLSLDSESGTAHMGKRMYQEALDRLRDIESKGPRSVTFEDMDCSSSSNY